MSLDGDEISDSLDTGETLYRVFRIPLFKVVLDLTFKRHPTLAHRHVNFAGRNPSFPSESIEHGSGQVGISALGKTRQAHLDVIGYRLNTTNAVSGSLGCDLFHIRVDPAGQRDNPVFNRYTNFVGMD